MNKVIGYKNTQPRIKTVRFLKGKIVINLIDGRTIIIPSAKFPEIERLSPNQKRKHKTLAGMGLMFEDLDTVFHISDFIGKEVFSEISNSGRKPTKKYSQKRVSSSKTAEPQKKYLKG